MFSVTCFVSSTPGACVRACVRACMRFRTFVFTHPVHAEPESNTVTWQLHRHPVFLQRGPLFYGELFNASTEGEVTRRMQGMNPLLVIWGWMCHALEFYHRHSMGWIPPFSLRRAMTVLFFLAGPEGGGWQEKGKGTQRREHKEGGMDWLGAVDKLSE